jgi:hypothetical protein
VSRAFNDAVKAALAVAFAVAIFWPPDVVEGKNMAARAPIFLAPAVTGSRTRTSPTPSCRCHSCSTRSATCSGSTTGTTPPTTCSMLPTGSGW